MHIQSLKDLSMQDYLPANVMRPSTSLVNNVAALFNGTPVNQVMVTT